MLPEALGSVASEPTLRQRMELFEDLPQSFLCKESALMVRRHAPAITRCFKDWVALDVDVSPFDNSNTKKEGIGCTYTHRVSKFPRVNLANTGQRAFTARLNRGFKFQEGV